MITRSPSNYDGKPVGTPTDSVSPQRAGCSMGPDQIERDDAARKARNRATKEAERAALKAQRRENWQSQQAGDARWWEYKQRRRRAMDMWRSIHNHGRSVSWCADVHAITPAQAFEELQWWEARRRRRNGSKRT